MPRRSAHSAATAASVGSKFSTVPGSTSTPRERLLVPVAKSCSLFVGLEEAYAWAPGATSVNLPTKVGGPLGSLGFKSFKLETHYNCEFPYLFKQS
jgi:hypothetical protein